MKIFSPASRHANHDFTRWLRLEAHISTRTSRRLRQPNDCSTHFSRQIRPNFGRAIKGKRLGPPTKEERNKPLGFLTLGHGSWRKEIEEEKVYLFSCSSLVLFLHLMF